MIDKTLSEIIENNFKYHAPTPEKLEAFQTIRTYAKDFADTINEVCPNTPEKIRAIRKLEEAMFLANAAIARN